MKEIIKNRLCIISGRYPASKLHSNINHKAYADKYGYTYINCNYPTQATNIFMNKIFFLKAYISMFDYLFWIDEDAFFFDFEKNIIDYLPKENSILSCCSSPDFKNIKTLINSGVFFLKCNDLGCLFIEQALNTNLIDVQNWWQKRHGLFTNGDQDIIVYLMETSSPLIGKIDIYNYKCFNSRPENIIDEIDKHSPLVVHFAGPDNKWEKQLLIQNKFKLGYSLVPNEYLTNYEFYQENYQTKTKIKRKLKSALKNFFR